MATVLFGTGLLLALVLLFSINRKLDGVPARIRRIDREERARDDARALTILQEAAAGKVGSITASLRGHEEQLVASVRAQLAEAQMQARVVERRSSEAGVALSAAAELVRELRALLDGLGAPRAQPTAEQAPAGPDRARETVMLGAPPKAAAGDDEPEEEPTKVAKPLGDCA